MKLQNYFTQPFYCAQPWTKLSGATVARTEALRACREILDGAHDDVPVEQFYFRGGIDDIRRSRRTGILDRSRQTLNGPPPVQRSFGLNPHSPDEAAILSAVTMIEG